MKKQFTIEDAIRSVPGFVGFEPELPEPFKEHIASFYCSDYSGAKRNMRCTAQCDACKLEVADRQFRTRTFTLQKTSKP